MILLSVASRKVEARRSDVAGGYLYAYWISDEVSLLKLFQDAADRGFLIGIDNMQGHDKVVEMQQPDMTSVARITPEEGAEVGQRNRARRNKHASRLLTTATGLQCRSDANEDKCGLSQLKPCSSSTVAEFVVADMRIQHAASG